MANNPKRNPGAGRAPRTGGRGGARRDRQADGQRARGGAPRRAPQADIDEAARDSGLDKRSEGIIQAERKYTPGDYRAAEKKLIDHVSTKHGGHVSGLVKLALEHKVFPTIEKQTVPYTVETSVLPGESEVAHAARVDAEKTAYEDAVVRENRRALDKWHDVKQRCGNCFPTILAAVTKQGKTRVEAHELFDAAYADNNSFVLLNIIAEVCGQQEEGEPRECIHSCP